MVEFIVLGVVLSVGGISTTIAVRKFRARIREINEHIRLCDLALLRGQAHLIFGLGNVSLAMNRVGDAVGPAHQYYWLRYDGRHGLFDVHPDVIEWSNEHIRGYKFENDESTGELVAVFVNENDRFHFKMRWM